MHYHRTKLPKLSTSVAKIVAYSGMLCAALVATVGCSFSAAESVHSANHSTAHEKTYYTSKTPYQPKGSASDYSLAPSGYQLVGVQHVARHGSRGLSSPDADDLVMQLWLQAQREQALTPLGKELGMTVLGMLQIHHDLGYGQLSELGRIEHREMAARVIARHKKTLNALPAEYQFGVMHSGRSRAKESGEAFVAGWLAQRPEDQARFQPDYADEHVVYFHSAEGSEGYDDYKDGPRVAAVMDGYLQDPRTAAASQEILQPLFTADFLARLNNSNYQFVAFDDNDDQINNAEDAALAIYDLFSIAINLSEEGAHDFTRFIPEQTREWLAFIDDADSFYGRGPGFADEDISYAAAGNLVRDMYQRASASASGESREFAMFRFTHAQALMPVATWLGLPDATQSAPENEPYTYSNNPWRAAIIAPMSANVQWDVYRHASDANRVLVRMLWNEQETRFAEHCNAYQGYFYELSELARCYNL